MTAMTMTTTMMMTTMMTKQVAHHQVNGAIAAEKASVVPRGVEERRENHNMSKWMKNLKLMAGVGVVLAMFAAVPVVYGGLSWTGIDPVLVANEHTMNVWVEWPTGRECDITGVISVDVHGADELISESAESFACGDDTVFPQTATTVHQSWQPYFFWVQRVRVPASESFPVQVKIYKDGVLATTCEGYSNSDVGCWPVYVGESEDDESSDD